MSNRRMFAVSLVRCHTTWVRDFCAYKLIGLNMHVFMTVQMYILKVR